MPFTIDVPENRYHVVSSWKHIKEIDAAPDSVLSLHGGAKDTLQPIYTMKEFNWMNKRTADTAPLLKSSGIDSSGHLSVVIPEIRRSMRGLLNELSDSQPTLDTGE